jgi:nitroreductase
MDAFLAIVSRREVREYAQRPVPEEVVRRILDAGRLSGSSTNKQQWRFYVVDGRETLGRLAELVYASPNVAGCAFAVAIATHGRGPVSFDAGRAAQNMLLAAWNEGVGGSPNGMPDRAAAGALLGLEEGEEAAIILSFGYPARAVDPERRSPEEWIERANRKPFDEVVRRVS